MGFIPMDHNRLDKPLGHLLKGFKMKTKGVPLILYLSKSRRPIGKFRQMRTINTDLTRERVRDKCSGVNNDGRVPLRV